MTTTATTQGAKLREEDLVPGQPWVHPETRLEYADFQAFLVGHDPLPHWRNARIKGVWAGEDDHLKAQSARWACFSLEEFRADRVAHYAGFEREPATAIWARTLFAEARRSSFLDQFVGGTVVSNAAVIRAPL